MYNVVNSSCKIEKYHGSVSVCNSYVFYILINHKTAWVLVFFRKKCLNMRHRQKLLGHYSFLGLPFEFSVPCYYIYYIFVNVKHKLYTLLWCIFVKLGQASLPVISPDSRLVQHQLITWWSALQPSHFDLLTLSNIGGTQTHTTVWGGQAL